MTEMKTKVAIDTYVNSLKPSLNYQQSSRLGVKGTEQRAYVYFARPFPLGATIISAKLKVRTYGMSTSATRIMTVRRTGERTTLSRLNWNTRPTEFASTTVTQTKTGILGGAHEWEFDVTANMQSVSDGGKWYGFVLSINENTQRWIYAEESEYGPSLEVEWSDAPSEPENLVPSGNLAVGTQKPTLRFDYVDLGGNTDLASVQVQINSTNTFTAPSFDSGWKDATVPELDLTTTLYAGLPVGGTSVWWRVRVKDGAGLESDWSDAEQMRYAARPVVNVISPTGQFYDTTQVISWSMTGGTQSAYQIWVTTEGRRTPLWNSGKVTSTETSVTVPKNIIRWDDKEYKFVVRLWDNVSRASTPGSPAYAQKTVVSLYDKDASIPDVVDLTLTDSPPRPYVTLSWTYDSLPDGWSISRDGEVIARLDSDDVPLSGGVYKWTDRGAPPHRESKYVVRPVVNGKTAYGSSGVRITPRPFGIWLIADDERSLCIVGQDSGSFEMTEHTTEHEVLGASSSTIVTQGIGGYKGEISGQLVGNLPGMDTSAKEWKDIALLFKEEASKGKTFRLVVGDMNIPVKIANLVPAPRPEQEIMFDVSFSFWQDGELPFDRL